MADSHKRPNANQRRDFGGDIGNSIFVLAFCAAGLGTLLDNKYRGDDYDRRLFLIAFSFGIAYSGAEIIASIIACILCVKTPCCRETAQKPLFITKSIFYIACSCTAFGLLVAALARSGDKECQTVCGCAREFGCANIIAIIAAIGYGLRVIYIALTISCLFCAACCACSACCIAAAVARSAAADEEATQPQPEKGEEKKDVEEQPPVTLNEIALTETTTSPVADEPPPGPSPPSSPPPPEEGDKPKEQAAESTDNTNTTPANTTSE